MLKQRIITAAFLSVVLFYVLWIASLAQVATIAALVVWVALEEWCRLNQVSREISVIIVSCFLGVATIVFLFDVHVTVGLWLSLLGGLSWFLVIPWFLLQRNPQLFLGYSRNVRLGVGWFILLVMWASVVWIRNEGADFLLLAIVIASVADSMAYVSGRLFGRRALALEISPNKTVEGVIGGVLAVQILGLLVWFFVGKHYGFINYATVASSLLTIFKLLVLSGLAVVGDLFESAVKRATGVKDSGRILPGHGGVLDRVDSHMAVLPGFVVLSFIQI